MKRFAFTLMALAAVGSTSQAIPPFQKEFGLLYVKPGTELETRVAEAKCNVCHMGTLKKDRNPYGMALSERLDKLEDAKNPEKIRAALETVGKLPSNGEGSPTFAELIKMGRLPGEK